VSVISINFFAFVAGTFIFGGDTIGGMEADGKYYLRQKEHLLEVSKTVFLYSKYHGLSVVWSFFALFGIPIAFAITKVGVRRVLRRPSTVTPKPRR
jgi:hypothetical protein